jgi:spore coat protein U-like protein
MGGTGSGAAQSIPVYGMVPLQEMPGPGDYTDNVVITVTY